MSRTSIVSIVSATLLAIGTAYWLNASEPRRKWPKATPPPPPSPIYHEVKEPVPTEQDIARQAEEHTARLQSEIERALDGRDEDRIQAVFVFLLPELIQLEPHRVVAMVAAREPGKVRDRLRTEVARQWVLKDQRAATEWIKSLEERERRAAAKVAVTELQPIDPLQATLFAKEFAADGVEQAREQLTSLNPAD
jgi:hypothetical protein